MKIIVAIAFTVGFLVTGCIQPRAHASRDADSSVAGIRAEVRELSIALAQFKTEQSAGRDVNQNDKWTLRLLGLGVLLMGLTYPVGKIIWLTSSAMSRRALTRLPTRTPEDLMPFRHRAKHGEDPLIRA
ncbi:MAG: hypothetical protein HZA51_03450 [Planctomycetes bacterium]|nr:hypothetical protein [Planctomycetota bacterium]